MKVTAENYGPVVLLHVTGEVAPDELEVFLHEVTAACGATSHVVIGLGRAEITAEVAQPLIALHEKQRFLKPAVWLVSPRLEQAQADSLEELLTEGLNLAEARLIIKITELKSEQARLKAREKEIDGEIRKLLILPPGYAPEEFHEACGKIRERAQRLRRLATVTRSMLETFRNARAAALRSLEAMSADQRAESADKVAKAKVEAYETVKGK